MECHTWTELFFPISEAVELCKNRGVVPVGADHSLQTTQVWAPGKMAAAAPGRHMFMGTGC
ncbi:MAG: hypothetical protein CM1200mP30_13690 [Pseudomonadota bacterium]|nr:MAG: hypothetical protein CM1200mP30_13690 [Pseudomonadota bacterium]